MKKLLVALVVAGILGGSVYAAAASFDLTGTNLGADDAVVTACGDLSISYTVAYDTVNAGYEVTDVTVTDPAPATCNGAAISVTLTDGIASVGTASGTIAGGTAVIAGTTGLMAVPLQPLVSAVEEVHVASSGGAP